MLIILFAFGTKQPTLMRKSTLLRLRLQLVFHKPNVFRPEFTNVRNKLVSVHGSKSFQLSLWFFSTAEGYLSEHLSFRCSKFDSWPYPQTLDKFNKPYLGQTRTFVNNHHKEFITLGPVETNRVFSPFFD
jgi:hypothetical protein